MSNEDLIKLIIEQELKKEDGVIRNHIQLELDFLTEGDWFREFIKKLIKEILVEEKLRTKR